MSEISLYTEIPRRIQAPGVFFRRRWDSNPRVVAHKLISSQPRYDRFDTSADYHDAGKCQRYTF